MLSLVKECVLTIADYFVNTTSSFIWSKSDRHCLLGNHATEHAQGKPWKCYSMIASTKLYKHFAILLTFPKLDSVLNGAWRALNLLWGTKAT